MEDAVTHIGIRDGWGGSYPFGISPADRRQHLYAVGRTGTGKTTLLRNLILQDIEAGRGVGLIDPHGDLANEILDWIPPRRVKDVVYFNPADAEYPVGLNLLRPARSVERHLVTSSIVSAFKSLWRDSWGPRLEFILSMAVSALLECENASLLGVERMLSDAAYRSWVVRKVRDPIVRSFWVNVFEEYGNQFREEAIAPIQNKAGQFSMSPLLRNVLGQVKSRIDARTMMDEGRIFIADVSKGRLGEDKSNLVGALLVTQFQLAAMSRSDVPEDERRDFMLHVDEFQSFSSDAFMSILSEARKYRLCLTLSHQYIDQLRPEIRDAVFGNVGSMISFRVGERDAKILEREFGDTYTASQFTSLNNHEVFAKLLHGGEWSQPFSGRTLAPVGTRYGRRETILAQSREKYARRRADVEDKIRRWMRAA